MTAFTWVIGIAITAWTGAMATAALLRTDGAKHWFGELLKQGPTLMTVNALGLLVAAALIALNLFMPTVINTTYVKFGLIGIGVAQLSTVFMLYRAGASRQLIAAPIILFILCVIYWFIRT